MDHGRQAQMWEHTAEIAYHLNQTQTTKRLQPQSFNRYLQTYRQIKTVKPSELTDAQLG